MAVDDQSLLRMIALTRPVAYAWPTDTRAGGCSLTAGAGTIHDTAGSFPVRAASKKSCNGTTFSASRSCRTVSKYGSGFQIPGVFEFCGTGAQNIASSPQ